MSHEWTNTASEGVGVSPQMGTHGRPSCESGPLMGPPGHSPPTPSRSLEGLVTCRLSIASLCPPNPTAVDQSPQYFNSAFFMWGVQGARA